MHKCEQSTIASWTLCHSFVKGGWWRTTVPSKWTCRQPFVFQFSPCLTSTESTTFQEFTVTDLILVVDAIGKRSKPDGRKSTDTIFSRKTKPECARYQNLNYIGHSTPLLYHILIVNILSLPTFLNACQLVGWLVSLLLFRYSASERF